MLWHRGCKRIKPILSFALAGSVAWGGNAAKAQIVPDGSLGAESSVVTPEVINNINSERITGGATRGNALFHSFQEFNIETGRAAYFSNPAGIENILNRVTGTNPSNILGILGVLGNANLFLINPNGIVFGPGASLDLRGSFLASTASSLMFDGFEFSVANPQAPSPMLQVNIPIGLRFRDNAAGPVQPITVNGGSLQVDSAKTLALVGGDLTLEGGSVTAQQGRIVLGSVAGESSVGVRSVPRGLALSYENVENFQDIRLSQRAAADASGEGGGDVRVRGQNISVTDGSQILADTLGAEAGGTLEVVATGSVEAIGRATDGNRQPSGLFARARGGDATGTGGTLTVTAPRLFVRDGARVTASSFFGGRGNAGSLEVNAAERVEVTGTGQAIGTETNPNLQESPSQISALTGGAGNAGNLDITTGQLILQGGGQVTASTFGTGNGGTLTVTASEQIEVIGRSPTGSEPSGILARVEEGATGNANNLTIETGRLSVSGGARVGTASLGQGNAGNLTIRATEIEAVGVIREADGTLNTDNPSQISALTTGIGNGGELTIETGQLTLTEGAQVNASTFGTGNGGSMTVAGVGDGGNLQVPATRVAAIGRAPNGSRQPSGLLARVEEGATGNARELTVISQQLSVQGGARVGTASLGQGNAGDLTIEASEFVEAIGDGTDATGQPNPSQISALTSGAGNGGNISIVTERLTTTDGSQINASTLGSGNSGSLDITAQQTIELSGRSADNSQPSGILARVEPGARGNATDVTVTTRRLRVRDGARVATASLGTGNAGKLTIEATEFVEASGEGTNPGGEPNPSQISALTAGTDGDGGDIEIKTQRVITTDGSQINASTSGSGNSGLINITGSEAIEINGRSADGSQPSGILARVESGAEGNARNITVTTRRLRVRDGARLAAASQGLGDAGTVTVNASELVEVSGGAEVSVRGLSEGEPGNLNILQGKPGIRLNQGSLSASSEEGTGGNIAVRGGDIVLRDRSEIFATGSKSGNPNLEGNLDLNGAILVLLQESRLGTDADLPRGGSNVTIAGLRARFVSPDSTIVAAGDLTIETDLEVGSPEIPQVQIVDPAGQISQNPCEQGEGSEFVVTGSGGLPPNPAEALNAPAVRVGLVEPAPFQAGFQAGASNDVSNANFEFGSFPERRERQTANAIIPARGWMVNDKGEVVLTAYDPKGTQPRRRWRNYPAFCSTDRE